MDHVYEGTITVEEQKLEIWKMPPDLQLIYIISTLF